MRMTNTCLMVDMEQPWLMDLPSGSRMSVKLPLFMLFVLFMMLALL